MNLKQMAQEVQKAGKGGDIHLIHVNDEELKIIKKALSHEGVVNEDTGLLSFGGSGETYTVQRVGANRHNNWGVFDSSGNQIGTTYNSRSAANSAQAQHTSIASGALANEQNMAMLAAYGALGQQNMASAYGYSVQAAERVEAQFPEWRQLANQSVEQDVPWLNRMITAEFEGSLDRLYPAWRTDIVGAAGEAQADSISVTRAFRERVMPRVLEAADQMGMQAVQNASSLLRGNIPKDVADQIRRSSAEIAQQIGSRGQAAGNIVARDLGLTSLQLQEAGLNQATAALGLQTQAYSGVASMLQTPVTTGANVTNLVNAYRAPVNDPAAWYQNYIGLISGQGAISPNTVLSTAAQVGTQFAQMGQQQGQFNTQLGQQSYWNQMNYNQQQQMIREAGETDTFGQVVAGIGAGAQILGAAAAFSDRRLKRDIEKVGTLLGVNIYKWNYVWGEAGVGVMADEVPWAAVMMDNGYYAVDYSKVFA